mmetsp:Transcript_45483/g.102731  ORF Transcript_45483/g.102731 Transcript_45483/m.102731 type:complete len:199 (+) Transcript_45483:1-597(+)
MLSVDGVSTVGKPLDQILQVVQSAAASNGSAASTVVFSSAPIAWLDMVDLAPASALPPGQSASPLEASRDRAGATPHASDSERKPVRSPLQPSVSPPGRLQAALEARTNQQSQAKPHPRAAKHLSVAVDDLAPPRRQAGTPSLGSPLGSALDSPLSLASHRGNSDRAFSPRGGSRRTLNRFDELKKSASGVSSSNSNY